MIRARKAAILAAALASCLAPAAANAPTQVGIAAALLNQVTIARGGAAQMRPAVLRQQVAMADRVETGIRSQLQILLLDRSTFTIGANARLTIDRFVYDPAQGRSMSASVAKGAFRFMSGRPSRGGNSTIATPVASIGIRGTIVDGVVGADAIAIAAGERATGGARDSDPQTATLVVLRGPGANTRGNVLPGEISVSAGGKTVTLDRPLLAVYVPRAGAQPIGPFALSLSALTRVQGLIFPSLAAWRLATTPAPSGAYPMPLPQQRRRRPPVMVGDPYGGGPLGDSGPSGGMPGYGAGVPSLPSLPRGTMQSPPRDPPPRTSTAQQEPVPAAAPTPAADPPQYQQPTPPPPMEPAPSPEPAPTPTPTPSPTPPPAPPPATGPGYPPTPNDAPPPSASSSPPPTYGTPNQGTPPRTTSGKN